ncbi:glycoside hydrolase, partial [Echria macrotheca]
LLSALGLVFYLSLSLFSEYTSAQSCSVAAPCEVGCCNSFGYCGFGPDYCGKTCVKDCDRKSDCDPGHGKEWSKSEKCPLNVCCSKYGFCGTTKDFCGNKTVKRPSCSSNNGLSRVIGYYEGWAAGRSCNAIFPEQIPAGVYSHINFAFATIDPKTFHVKPWDAADVGLYERLMLLKKKDPFLKIMVAIGGWAFNDPGPTRTTFSDLAASVSRQKAFIDSLVSFMATYGFDGIDVDWEYPEADDRAGRAVDFENYPKFMARLKTALSATGGRNLLSITLPASYWYLQHFDLKSLAKEVSWFNVMSYDLHGMWDFPNKWTGPYLNAHTNLTEISDALDLIWRNDIKPEMVVLGLGFYGRAFRATSQSCLEPGCTFQQKPAEGGRCSKEPGILLNSEIDQIVKERNIKPKLYKDAAVKVATWANQWVAYDDEETFGIKSTFAQSHCMGGLMVWAISHDTADAKYSKAIAKVANRRAGPQAALSDDSPVTSTTVPIPQCKWMGCGEGCPSGWIHMKRSDSDRHDDNEYMLWDKGCEDPIGGTRPLCCPTDNPLPQCGWYTHHNGACEPGCPSGFVETATTDAACRHAYQSACCKISKSTDLYTTCEWGPWPACDALKQCPWKDSSKNTLVATSIIGLGGSLCDDSSPGRQQRKLCCNNKDSNKTWKNCKWYQELLDNDEYFKLGFNTCKPTCPKDLVLVAQDLGDVNVDDPNNVSKCVAGGRANCCEASYTYEKITPNPVLDEYRQSAQQYLQAPTCPNPDSVFRKRSSGMPSSKDLILKRSDPVYYSRTSELLLTLLTGAAAQAMLDALGRIWDSTIGQLYTNMKIANLRDFAKTLSAWTIMGPIYVTHKFLCLPDYWNDRIAFWLGTAPTGTQLLDCATGKCSTSSKPNTDYGCLARQDPDGPGFVIQPNSIDTGSSSAEVVRTHLNATSNQSHRNGTVLVERKLGRRGNSRDFDVKISDPDTGQSSSFSVTLPAYPSAGPSGLDGDDPLNDEVLDVIDWDDCTETRIRRYSLPYGGRYVATEHLIEGQMIPLFIQHAVAGTLPSGRRPRTPRVPAAFFLAMRRADLPVQDLPPLPGGAVLIRGLDRIMECLGSETNRANFVLCQVDINAMKALIMVGKEPISRDIMAVIIQTDPAQAIAGIRYSIAAIRYINYRGTPSVNVRLGNIVNNVHSDFLGDHYNSQPGNENNQAQVSNYWAEWAVDHMEWAGNHAQTWAREWLQKMKEFWSKQKGDFAKKILAMIAVLEAEVPDLIIDTDFF